MRRFDSCLLISRYDKESLDGHEGLANVFYSPHGVDVDHYTRMENVERENAILFCGVLETPTNLDAAMYFYKQIYPLVKEQVRDVRFYLMGKNPPRAIRRIAEKDPSVIVPGFVKDLRPYYSKARVGIDPLRIGAGLQNKLLISMCMELPMVSTSVANEGIAAEPGRHLLIGDTARDFADAVVELLRNKNKAENIAREARRFVEEKWTWEYHFEALEKHFVELVSGH
jgi:glycosyltransferase involved in cell wall biosynthesis